mgnify:CR=1 FL=1
MIAQRETYSLYIPENIRIIDTLFYKYIEVPLGFKPGSINEYLEKSDFSIKKCKIKTKNENKNNTSK